MSTSRRKRRLPAKSFSQQALALAWGAWAELGVSGWTVTHQQWAIDPEPLILFTGFLADRDPRLRDEATDWCIGNWRYVSKARLKNLLRNQPETVRDGFGEFAATVSANAAITWPGKMKPRPYAITGRSRLPPLDRPSLAWIRLRAMFGLGARAEILRYFLMHGNIRASVALIAQATGCTKRNIAEECETLERAGVLAVRSVGNRFSYSLARRAELDAFVGDLPEIRPDWTAMLNVARELVLIEEEAGSATQRTLAVRVRKTVDRIEGDLDELDIKTPFADWRGEDLWPALREFGNDSLGAWSIGDWRASAPIEESAKTGKRRPRAALSGIDKSLTNRRPVRSI